MRLFMFSVVIVATCLAPFMAYPAYGLGVAILSFVLGNLLLAAVFLLFYWMDERRVHRDGLSGAEWRRMDRGSR